MDEDVTGRAPAALGLYTLDYAAHMKRPLRDVASLTLRLSKALGVRPHGPHGAALP